MFTVTKRLEISAAHSLTLDYSSPCNRLHGHNWIIEVTCQREKLNRNGMVVDFKKVKQVVTDMLDHQIKLITLCVLVQHKHHVQQIIYIE